MHPTRPLHLSVVFLLALCTPRALGQFVPYLTATFDPPEVTLHMDESAEFFFTMTGVDAGVQAGDTIHLSTNASQIASVDFSYQLQPEDLQFTNWTSPFMLDGHFLGYTEVRAAVRRQDSEYAAQNSMRVIVIRAVRVIDTVFTSSVGVLVGLIFINFGCAMHWPTVVAVLKRPVGPAICMLGQFVFLPLCSFALGLIIFPDNAEMRLGMFFTGVSPGGGASNIWTFILGGNLNLSLAMTTISTLFAFGAMPAWLFSLGQVIFADANIGVPYGRIASFIVTLLVPLAFGFGMQRWTPRIAAFMVRILKGFSSALLLFIIVFAIITNLYIFELFSWRIVVAGMGIPWLGYSLAYLTARLLRQPHEDALAICIETGVQNTGIAIFLLRFALPQPAADLTTVIPVSVAIMTPIPMMAIYTYQRIMGCIRRRNKDSKDINEETPVTVPVSVAEDNKMAAVAVATRSATPASANDV